jgi:uncharacterized membrane protein YqjE
MPAPPSPSFFENATAWLGTLLAHLRVRLKLAGIEGKEAAVHYGVLLGLAVAGLLFGVFGYFFLCLALVFLIAWASGGGNAWIWVLLGMSVLHLGGAAGVFFWIKGRLGAPMFSATLDELRKDQEWLTSTTEKRR